MREDKLKKRDIEEFILKEDKTNDYFKTVVRRLECERQIILFGAGNGGRRTFEFMKRYGLGNRAVCFADNNSRKWNTYFCGLQVLSLEEVKQRYSDGFVVISCGEGDVITDQCIRNGFKRERVFIPDLIQVDDENKNEGKNDFQFIWRNMDGFAGCYGALTDERSRQVLINIMNYRISHQPELLQEVYDKFENQYFDEGLIHFTGKEIFLDCGAYTGDTLDRLLELNDFREGEIHCFETDDGNYKILEKYVAQNSVGKVFCHKIAVWNKKAILAFNAVGSGSGFVSGEPSWGGGDTMWRLTA